MCVWIYYNTKKELLQQKFAHKFSKAVREIKFYLLSIFLKTIKFEGEFGYNICKFDTTGGWVKVPFQELSDAMVEAFKDRLKPD